jgi:thioredoxin-like negative regulator of GroEL
MRLKTLTFLFSFFMVTPAAVQALTIDSIDILAEPASRTNVHKQALDALRNDNYAQAVTLASNTIAANPFDARAHLILVLSWAAQDNKQALNIHLDELDVANPELAASIRVALASYYARTQRYNDAQATLGTVPEPYQTEEYHRLWGDIHRYHMDVPQARAAYQRALNMKPEDPDILTSLAGVEMLAGNYTRALDYANLLLALTPENPRYLSIAITAQLKLGKITESLSLAKSLIASETDEASALSVGALSLFANAQYTEATRVFQELHTQPTWRDYSVAGMALSLTLDGRQEEALQILREKQPEEPALTNLVWLANHPAATQDERRQKLTAMRPIWIDTGRSVIQPAELIGSFAQQARPNDDLLAAATAHLYLSQGFARLAIRQSEAIGNLDASPVGRLIKARLLAKTGDLRQSSGILDGLISDYPKLAAPRLEKAELEFQAGRPELALAGYEETLGIASDIPELRVRFGDLLNAVGKPREAFSQYQQYLATNPDSTYALNQAAATLSGILGEHDKALPLALRAYQRAPNDHQVVDTLASIYQRLGMPQEAQTVIAAYNNASQR